MDLLKKDRDKLCQTMAGCLPMLRVRLGLSQEDLARRVDMTRQTISAFESNQRIMPWNVFLAFLMLFTGHPATKRLLRAMDVYTPELDDFLTMGDDSEIHEQEVGGQPNENS